MLRHLDDRTVNWLIRYGMVPVHFSSGAAICEKGCSAADVDILYLLCEGTVKVHDIGLGDSQHDDLMLTEHDCFGDCVVEVVNDDDATPATGRRQPQHQSPLPVRAASVTAVTAVRAFAVDRSVVRRHGLAGHLLERETARHLLRSIPLFSSTGPATATATTAEESPSAVTESQFDGLVDRLDEVCFRRGHAVLDTTAAANRAFAENDMSSLWIVRSGRVIVYDSNKGSNDGGAMCGYEAGDYFGDKFIVNDDKQQQQHLAEENNNNKSTSHCCHHRGIIRAVCEENCTAWVLSREDIETVLGSGSCVKRLRQHAALHRIQEPSSPRQHQRQQQQHGLIRMADLIPSDVLLGSGAFGEVWLVHCNKPTDAQYALKVMNKKRLLKGRKAKSAVREREFLHLLRHPFIVNLVASYQDADRLYLLQPYVPGGELTAVLKRRSKPAGGLPATEAAFYAANIVEALRHFHGHRIAYRDLKLQNVLLDEAGYCKVVDLGFAKLVADKTYTVVGTPEYFAPEIIACTGHDCTADYWSFGVLVYQLLTGKSPFLPDGNSSCSSTGNRKDMLRRIMMCQYTLPSRLSDSAKSFLSELLRRDPASRLGGAGGANGYLAVKKHCFFRECGISFQDILSKNVKAPWKPPAPAAAARAAADASTKRRRQRSHSSTERSKNVFETKNPLKSNSSSKNTLTEQEQMLFWRF